ncbi:isocitrate lyase/phosphoenolpyruvate mutase family protein [Streptomyces sp. APSN-46.1]|uniref:isocitrate lyase/PEP mutase family protein n=1 Tax=Streptomyces sp. APSN-46.1 TaxID=2929049 RepID=UPI001FB22774|nr:isocitrate lyase/phosphoenolpyruvate mutase family protein [Streptomyces sp. APSN-46.1]MCJ1678219.1 isocitrate lyase/phosphoenolpyruvate mutase family protein [Streptomyces sp. APSN-46.1]
MAQLKAAESFLAMHDRTNRDGPLVIPNVWDAGSARAYAEAGFPALATSSAAISASLGYEDGGGTPADEMFAAIARIVRSVDVPVTADIEAGYGLAPQEIVERLLETGAVGCNLEDSEPLTGEVKDAEEHANWLAEVSVAAGDRIVLNARVDTFLYGDKSVESAVRRARLYIEAGADVIFPILAPVGLLPDIAECVSRPVNALYLPGGTEPKVLGTLGAARVTFGGTLYSRAMDSVLSMAREL